MRPSLSLVLACLLAGRGRSWVFPPGMEDGHYTVTLRRAQGSGAETAAVVTRRSPRPPPGDPDMMSDPEPPLPPVREVWHFDRLPLPVDTFYCRFDTFPFSPRAYLEARKHFQTYCEAYLVPERTIHISVARNGSLGIFACNLATWPQPCSVREFKWAEDYWLDLKCGGLVSGQVDMPKRHMWYGRAYPGDMLCPPRTNNREDQRYMHLDKQVLEGLPKGHHRLPVADKPVLDKPAEGKPAGKDLPDGDFPDDFPDHDFPGQGP